MLAFAFFAMMGVTILPAKGNLVQYNSTILSEKLILHKNDYISLEIVGKGEDSIVYMNVDQKIDRASDIMFKLTLKRPGQIPLVPILTEVNLCTLLWNEVNEPSSVQATYRMSQAFNLDGYQCPIDKKTVKLVPWVLKNHHTFDSSMNCGNYHYELSLEQCHPYVSCQVLIVADLEINMISDDCYH